jgi:hypothetical protein
MVGGEVCPCSGASNGVTATSYADADDDAGDDYESLFPEETSSSTKSGLSTGGAVGAAVVVTLVLVGVGMLAARQVVSRRRAAPQLQEPLTLALHQATGDAAL